MHNQARIQPRRASLQQLGAPAMLRQLERFQRATRAKQGAVAWHPTTVMPYRRARTTHERPAPPPRQDKPAFRNGAQNHNFTLYLLIWYHKIRFTSSRRAQLGNRAFVSVCLRLASASAPALVFSTPYSARAHITSKLTALFIPALTVPLRRSPEYAMSDCPRPIVASISDLIVASSFLATRPAVGLWILSGSSGATGLTRSASLSAAAIRAYSSYCN